MSLIVNGLQRSGTNLMESSCIKCLGGHHVSGRLADRGSAGCDPVDRDGESLRYLEKQPTFQGGRNLPCWKHYRIFTNSIKSHNVTINDLSDYDSLRQQPKHDTKFLVIIKSPFVWLSSDAFYHNVPLTEVRIHEYVYEWKAYVIKWERLWQKHPDRVVLLSYEHVLNNISSLRALETILSNTQIMCIQNHVRFAKDVSQSEGQTYKNNTDHYLKCRYFENKPLLTRVAMHLQNSIDLAVGPWKYTWNHTCMIPAWD